jgi:hypothetical protein
MARWERKKQSDFFDWDEWHRFRRTAGAWSCNRIDAWGRNVSRYSLREARTGPKIDLLDATDKFSDLAANEFYPIHPCPLLQTLGLQPYEKIRHDGQDFYAKVHASRSVCSPSAIWCRIRRVFTLLRQVAPTWI